MSLARPAPLALILLALGAGEARPQSSLAPTPGSLAPPRAAAPMPNPAGAPRLVPAEQPRNLAAPPARPAAPQSQQAPAQPFRAPQVQAPARPAATPARPPTTPARPRATPPTVGGTTPPANRRPAAAAAATGAAAAAAAAATAAAARPPAPALPATPAAPTIGPATGLPLPRFAALRSDEVNMRVGPSTSYPIEWTFQRRDLPVQIVGEFQLWRRIRDAEGAEGWVHSSTLAGRRTVLVRPPSATPEATLRRRAEEGAAAVARIRPGVIARIRECEADAPWCEVQVSGHRGYLRRAEIWGVGATEEIK
ncbi:SH3 domain-containing protein [Falsiroseomonas sp. E2-1-a20]|uniref:SH3 domain-containing protein n=1 Tax=Falsiroseomonas sp. E2-1-a20 TaxID=3239300 RepID=UPI003F335078